MNIELNQEEATQIIELINQTWLDGFDNQELNSVFEKLKLALDRESLKGDSLLVKIEHLGISTRTKNIFISNGILTVGELINLGAIGALKLNNFGRGAQSEVTTALLKLGLTWPIRGGDNHG